MARGHRIAWALAPLLLVSAGVAQELPQEPGKPWRPPVQLSLPRPGMASSLPPLPKGETLPLAALIDLAESRNPATAAAWQCARQAAAQKGVAKSALYPLLTSFVLGQTLKEQILFGSSFVRQNLSVFEPTLELDYLLFDSNARLDAVRAAQDQLLAANFGFNEVHLDLIRQVSDSYYALLNDEGQVAAAQSSLENARAITAQEDARLAQGLATLPDALEARAASAQAQFTVVSLQGANTNAQADLATALRLPARTVLPVVPLDRLAPPEALEESAVQAIATALETRPDLLVQEAQTAAAAQELRRARTAYIPQLGFTGQYGFIRQFGTQAPASIGTYGSLGRYNLRMNLTWTVFDGFRRRNELMSAKAAELEADARLDAVRDRIEDEVWTAYTNLQTALAQQRAAQSLLEAATSSYAAATEALASGVRTLVDVLTAQRALAQARSEDVQARTNLFVQATELAYRTGALLGSHNGPALLPPPGRQP